MIPKRWCDDNGMMGVMLYYNTINTINTINTTVHVHRSAFQEGPFREVRGTGFGLMHHMSVAEGQPSELYASCAAGALI